MSYRTLLNFQPDASTSTRNSELVTLVGTVNAPASQTEYTISSIRTSLHFGRFVITDVRYRLVSQVGAPGSNRNFRMRGSSTNNTIHVDTSTVTWLGSSNTTVGSWWIPTLSANPYLLPGDNPLIRDGLSGGSATSFIISVMITGFYLGR